MMDLDSAIQHCEEVADTPCFTDEEARCYSEHRQLAEWLKELKAYKETWRKLGMWLADTRLAIAPDEFLNDVDEELVRVAQVDMIDTVLEWMDKHEVEAKQNCTDCIIDGTDACSRGAGRAVDNEICGDFIPNKSEIPTSCDDAISRQEVQDAMYDLCDTGETLKENPWRDNPHIDAIIDAIDDLPSVTTQQRTGRWIPVSERLPEKATRVLTSWVYVPTGAKYIEVAERWGDDDDYTFYGDTDEYKMNRKDHKVIAWMPLVEPYKAESEEV